MKNYFKSSTINNWPSLLGTEKREMTNVLNMRPLNLPINLYYICMIDFSSLSYYLYFEEDWVHSIGFMSIKHICRNVLDLRLY